MSTAFGLVASLLVAGTDTERLLTYALGRGVEYYDMLAVRRIVRNAEANDHRWSSVILGIVNSTLFRMKLASDATIGQ